MRMRRQKMRRKKGQRKRQKQARQMLKKLNLLLVRMRMRMMMRMKRKKKKKKRRRRKMRNTEEMMMLMLKRRKVNRRLLVMALRLEFDPATLLEHLFQLASWPKIHPRPPKRRSKTSSQEAYSCRPPFWVGRNKRWRFASCSLRR